MNCAVTVCDLDGVVVYMNERSRATFNKDGKEMRGQSMLPCHNERSRGIINSMLADGSSNCYTISKNGQRKLIYQTPWRKDGEIMGLVELSIVLPDDMPHYVR